MNRNTTLPARPRRPRVLPHGDPSRLTPGQRHTLEFIWDQVLTTGEAPTVREVCADAKVTSISTGQNRLISLQKHGFIRIEPDVWRGIRILVWPPKDWTRPARSDAA